MVLVGMAAAVAAGRSGMIGETMSEAYVHGYHWRESERLHDQAGTLVELLHSDTAYPSGSTVLEVGCGVGAQTVTLARRSPDARFTSIDVSPESIAEARQRVDDAGLTTSSFARQTSSPYRGVRSPSITCLCVSSWSTSPGRCRR